MLVAVYVGDQWLYFLSEVIEVTAYSSAGYTRVKCHTLNLGLPRVAKF